MIKKITLNILLVCLMVFVLDFAIGKTLKYFYFKEKAGLHFRTTYSMEKTNAEILVFGSSRANHHYIPEIFEDSLKATFYNTGRDGNGIFYQTALLKSILKRYTPKFIILDYAGGFGRLDRKVYDNLSSLLPYYYSHKEIRKEIELRSPFERIKLVSKIYPFNSQILTIGIGNMDINEKRKPDNKGYVPLVSERAVTMEVYSSIKEDPIDSNKVKSFSEFVIVAKKSGAKVYIIYSPLFQQLSNYNEIAICNEICLKEGVPFFDFSRDRFYLNRGDLFYDGVHLNNDGATILSKMVAHRILNNAGK